jgi:lipopolysaccharide transport system ATP-binding protein
MRDVIRVERLSKSFAVYSRPADLVKEVFTRRRLHDVFWALKDISFSVGHRQRLGIIGPNGSGKTTLLRIITGNLPPTAGRLDVNGRISAMLSLNSVLNPDETGLDNIRFNLLLNGCPRQEIDGKTEDIVDFAELGPFVYKPVRTFSSGMNARLAFALTTALEPDILVVDEVLAVGDAYFVGKAMKRMLDVCDRGRALLFVSHSTADVQRLCDTVLWLDHGAVRRYGPARDVLKEYEEDFRRQEDLATRESNAARRAQTEYLSYAEELAAELFRLRLVAAGSKKLTDTHYVRRIHVAADGAPSVAVIAEGEEARPSDHWAWIDAIGSEWSRQHEHRSFACRMLYSQTGRRQGGQILVRRQPGVPSEWPLTVEVEAASDAGHEQLALECLDLDSGAWRAADLLSREPLGDGWERARYCVVLKSIPTERLPEFIQRFRDTNKPDVDILDVAVYVNGERRSEVEEGTPFEVRVMLEASRLVPLVDVGVKIMRVDGVYVFWQSSGMAGQNLRDVGGRVEVAFRFDPNCIGSGRYLVSSSCHNGWDIETNYPYQHVFARRVNACELVVTRRDPRLDLGQVNMIVPVTVTRLADAIGEHAAH